MLELVTCVGFWLAAVVVSEAVLAGRKVQTGLLRAVLVYSAAGLALQQWASASGRLAPASVMVFWAGAFLTWFCVRSHLESSILLRLVYMMRPGPVQVDELLERYENFYGHERRVEELVRANLAVACDGEIRITRKGAIILRIAGFFS